MYQFLHSTEFLVIVLTLAALLVGLIVKPSRRGQAETSFARGELYPDADPTPRLEFRVTSSGLLEISRCGLVGLTSADSVSIAITRIGFDLEIEERIVHNDGPAGFPIERAVFTLDNLAPERYHIRYNSSAYSTFLATSLTVRPGISFSRPFPTH